MSRWQIAVVGAAVLVASGSGQVSTSAVVRTAPCRCVAVPTLAVGVVPISGGHTMADVVVFSPIAGSHGEPPSAGESSGPRQSEQRRLEIHRGTELVVSGASWLYLTTCGRPPSTVWYYSGKVYCTVLTQPITDSLALINS